MIEEEKRPTFRVGNEVEDVKTHRAGRIVEIVKVGSNGKARVEWDDGGSKTLFLSRLSLK
jgi:hypothetical protein